MQPAAGVAVKQADHRHDRHPDHKQQSGSAPDPDGSNLFNSVAGGGGNTFRALDKKTGRIISEIELPASATGIPMTYMADGRQFVVVAVGAVGVPAELVALALP